ELLEQDLLDLQPVGRGEPVARKVDQARGEAAIRVAAHEQPQLPAAGQAQHAYHRAVEVVGGNLEQLVARVGLQDLHQGLAGVAARRQPGPVDHLGDLASDHWQVPYARPVGGRGEQAEEAALPHHIAVGVEELDADVVQVRRAVHGGAG